MGLMRTPLVLVVAFALVTVACESDPEGMGPGVNVMPGADAGAMQDSGSTTPDASEPPPVDCDYPMAGRDLVLGQTMPAFAWRSAIDENGNDAPFSMQEFFCDDTKYGDYRSLLIVAGAGWCPNCPGYTRGVNDLREQVAAAGGLVLYIEGQDERRNPASTEWSNTYINSLIGSGAGSPGLRIGEDDAEEPGWFFNQFSAVPSVFIVRRSDMVVSFHSGINGLLSPEGLPSKLNSLMPEIPEPVCGPGDEESTEGANDMIETAPVLEPGSFMGGICEIGNGDYYKVETEGDWTIDLMFTHADGDIDIYLLDPANPMMAIGSSDSTDDNEQLTGTGPGTVLVVAYPARTATNIYQLTFTPAAGM